MATGEVLALAGTVVASDAGGFGFVPASAFDHDLTTLAHLGGNAISGNTVANPTVVTTTAAHGLTTGDEIEIASSDSTPTLNGTRTVTVLSATTFSVPVNVTVAGTTGSFNRGYIGLRLTAGSTRRITGYRGCPRPSTTDGSWFERYMHDSQIRGSITSAILALTTLVSTTQMNQTCFRRARLNEVPITDATAWEWMRFSNNNYAQHHESQYIVAAASGSGSINSRPLEVRITPGGGRFNSSLSRAVTMSCRTTSARIFYTTDGTTPAHTAGTPSGTTLEYTVPIAVVPTVAGVTVKALAYDATCSTTDSMVATTALFQIKNMPQNDRWYEVGDLSGFSLSPRTVEAHACCVIPPSKSGNGYYYKFGHFSDATNIGNNPGECAITCYRSTDCVNWTFVNFAVSGYAQGIRSDQGDLMVRPNVVYRPSTGKWIMWCKASSDGGVTSKCFIYSADTLEGPWSPEAVDQLPINNAGVPRTYTGFSDFSFFEEDNGDIYVVASVYQGATGYVACQKMAANGLSCTGTIKEFTNGATTREACVMLKYAGNYFLITSITNYYDPSISFDVRYIVGTGGTTPLNATWGALDGASIFSSVPAPDTTFNAQPANIVVLPGVGMVLMMDYWHKTENFQSNQVWVPLTFPTTTTLLASQAPWYPSPATGSPNNPIPGASGGATLLNGRRIHRKIELTRHTRRASHGDHTRPRERRHHATGRERHLDGHPQHKRHARCCLYGRRSRRGQVSERVGCWPPRRLPVPRRQRRLSAQVHRQHARRLLRVGRR